MDITNLTLEQCESMAFRLVEQQKIIERDLSVVCSRIATLRKQAQDKPQNANDPECDNEPEFSKEAE